MSGIITVKSPWSEWTIEKQMTSGKYATGYLASKTQDGEKYYSSVQIISIPASQDDIGLAIQNGTSPDAASLDQYFLSIVNSFVEKIRSVQKLGEHANIVQYEDCLVQKNGEIGYQIFLRTEHLSSLAEYLGGKDVNGGEIAALGADICSAINACSSVGVVHGDIKPINLYVSQSGSFKLGNFGMDLLQNGGEAGNGATLAYMAPERNSGNAPASANSDLYSLGLVLYWLMNDRTLPFFQSGGMNSQENFIGRRLGGEPIPMPSGGDDTLRAIVMKELSFLPSERFRSAEVFRTALMNYRSAAQPAASDISGGEPTVWAMQRDQATYPQPTDYPPNPVYAQSAENGQYPQQMGYGQNPVPPYAQPINRTAPPKKSHTLAIILIIAGVVVFLAIALLAALFFLGAFSEKDPDGDGVSSEAVVSSDTEDDDASSDEVIYDVSDDSSNEEEITPDPTNIIPVESVSCSKHAGNGKYNRKYGADMAVDGNPETCWMAYGNPAGKGNWIMLDFGQETTISGIEIINGNTWDGYYKGSYIDGYDNLYNKNGRLCKYELEFSDGTRISGKAADVDESDFSANIIYFDQPVVTSYVKLYVRSGYKGVKYKNNVCIGEIQAFC